jgi:hypothetical protein
MNRDEILRAIKEQHAELDAALAGTPADQLTKRPIIEWWTAKDLLGHVTLWEQVALKHIREYTQAGVPKPLGITGDDDVDRYNKRGVAMRRDLSFETIRAELDATWRELVAAIESLSDADLVKPLPAPWSDGATLERLIAVNSYQHVPEHIEQIEKWKLEIRGQK